MKNIPETTKEFKLFAFNIYIIQKKEKLMAKKIYMTNLKGGTGVTTCCVGLGIALAESGERTLIVDGDTAGGCALYTGGCANMQTYTLADFERGACRAKQTLVTHKKAVNLSFMSSLGLTDKAAAARAVDEVDGLFDYILLDKIAPEKCGCALIVSEPFAPSIKSTDFCKAKLSDGGIREIGLIINKLNGGQVISGDVMSAQEIASLLRLPLKAVIPEDLFIPLGKWKKSTLKAFKIAAENISGRRTEVFSAVKPYFGPGGYLKRKMREMI